jgi:hypothetical protein
MDVRKILDIRWLVLAALPAAALAAGCGDDDDNASESSKPKGLALRISGSGKNLRLTAPKTAPAGLTRITLTNAAKGEHSAQLGRVDPGHTAQQGLAAAGTWAEKGKALPSWTHVEGGVPVTPAGTTHSSTQVLRPGKYFVIDTNVEGGNEPDAFFEVTGSDSGELTAPAARIDAVEYAFRASGLRAGSNPVLIDNKGRQPHFIDAAPIKPGKTIADVRRFVRSEKGEPPIIEDRTVSTPVLDGGVRQIVDLNLRKGNYALLCFVPDRTGGPPHALKGMVSQVVVR